MNKKAPKFVKVRDLVTGEISTIPSSELKPSMTPISAGNEVVWIDREQLQVVQTDRQATTHLPPSREGI